MINLIKLQVLKVSLSLSAAPEIQSTQCAAGWFIKIMLDAAEIV